MTELIGTTLRQYHILEEIGRGGMGAVYKGYDTALEREVAIKVLAPHLVWEQGLVERFLREAKTAARLRHPHIVTIYNVGQQDGSYYFVMEYLEGRTLAEVIRREGALPPQRVARIAGQMASALDYAHAQGLVHRDIKPANIIVGPDDQATLTDFGIVKALAGTSLTRTGTFIGTPEYVSPEQARGQAVDHRSDIYSLGVVCYEMLSGRVPFVGDTLAVLHAHGYEPPPPLRSLNLRVPAALEPVIGQALAKKAAERQQSAGELARALAVAASGVVPQPRPAPVSEPPTVMAPPEATRLEPARRRFSPALIWGIGVGLAVILIAAAVYFGRGPGGTLLAPLMATPTAKPTDTLTLKPPTVVLTDTPIPTKLTLYTAPTMIAPLNGEHLNGLPLTFKWESTYLLGDQEYFAVKIWQASRDETTSPVLLKESQMIWTLSAPPEPGQYEWDVVIVKAPVGEIVDTLSEKSETWTFYWEGEATATYTPTPSPTDTPTLTRVPPKPTGTPTFTPEPPTPTDTPTWTPIPPTPTDTPTLIPTPTPTPAPIPPIVEFGVTKDTINFGECTTLQWQVENITAAFLSGGEFSNLGIAGPFGSRDVCPVSTTQYILRAETAGGSVERSVMVTVREKPSGCPRKGQGDANCDGLVDGVDYSIWLNSQCRPAAGQVCSDLRADFDLDGDVDDDDYNIWFVNRD